MAKTSPRLPISDFFQPNLGAFKTSNASVFEGILMQRYYLQRWASIFQVIEAEASKNPMMSPEGIRRAKGEVLKNSNHKLPLVNPILEYPR